MTEDCSLFIVTSVQKQNGQSEECIVCILHNVQISVYNGVY